MAGIDILRVSCQFTTSPSYMCEANLEKDRICKKIIKRQMTIFIASEMTTAVVEKYMAPVSTRE